MPFFGREMRSKIDVDGRLTLSLEDVVISDPTDDEIVVRVEAAPINPSDLGTLLGSADVSTCMMTNLDGRMAVTCAVPRLGSVQGRLGESLPIGNEGAGVVVAAGRNVRRFEGKRVGMFGGRMYADYRLINYRDVICLPEGTSAHQGAAMFVNPLTALGFVETARRGGHRAIVHTAAASSLGQMLHRVCHAEGMPLVNIVRSKDQADLLTAMGALHVLNSKDQDFRAKLTQAMVETGATVAFDAIGGGSLGSDIIQAMERAAAGNAAGYDRYGSNTFKQLYIYGALDLSPTMINRFAIGFRWSISGWLLLPFLEEAGVKQADLMRQRVVNELATTFANNYTRTIGLSEAIQPDVIRAYERKATGQKYLIDPTLN